MSTFGKKHARDWNAADNATNAVAHMLAAEIQAKRERMTYNAGRYMAVMIGLAIAVAYLAVDYFLI